MQKINTCTCTRHPARPVPGETDRKFADETLRLAASPLAGLRARKVATTAFAPLTASRRPLPVSPSRSRCRNRGTLGS